MRLEASLVPDANNKKQIKNGHKNYKTRNT